MFDILAIDWGSVRFGLAFGSSKIELVIPCVYNCETVNIWSILEKEISERKIEIITLGMPMTRQLKDTEISLKVKNFLKKLSQKFPQIPIEIVNERNTTAKAMVKILNQPTKNKSVSKHGINHNSAVEILNHWLESRY